MHHRKHYHVLKVCQSIQTGKPSGNRQILAEAEVGSGGGIRTHDLRVMSPTSCQTALPRVIYV